MALYAGAPATPAVAQPSTEGEVHRVCGAARPGYARCMALKLTASSSAPTPETKRVPPREEQSGGGTPAVTVKTPTHCFLTPAALHTAYSLPAETSSAATQTVAVIDAFDDPTAEADLRVYDEQFGLPACTSANGCFRKVDQEGKASPLPRKEGEWASEISIDVQMAHAICQNCDILLVEADNESFADLTTAVDAAASLGATEISNSYGAPEQRSYLSSFAGAYDHPGLVIAASSGDCGYLNKACPEETQAAEFPADSPDVIAVGGTSLRHTGKTWKSTAWDEGGSACSELFAAPKWQSAAPDFSATGCGEQRAIADVAAVANPNTGVDVYDSTPETPGAPTGWMVFGGTSVSSPIVAAEFALAGGSHGVPFPAATLYSHVGESGALSDVVEGKNGTCHRATICRAVVGYDGPSGVGSPIGLGAFSP
jgi:subtilase family serine protease